MEFTVYGSREKMVNAAFMKKYIHVAKIIKPILTQESAAYIAEEYSRLRSQDSMSSDTARVSPQREDGPGSPLGIWLGKESLPSESAEGIFTE